jgi:iron complex transport system ATP-binding protein
MSIVVSGLTFSYTKESPVLRDISFEVESGEMVCLLGPNGVGKSTLFQCMLGLLAGYSGNISIDEESIKKTTPKKLAQKIAYVPQSVAHIFNYSVHEVVLMGTTALTNQFSSPGAKEIVYATQALEKIQIEYLKDKMFLQISGGERQLVLIARALAQQAKILFMDEPTANLDYGNQVRVMEQIKQLTTQGYTIVLSTHNPDQAFLYADRVLAIHEGKIAAYGQPNDIMNAELMKRLYSVDIFVESLFEDRIRVCVPQSIFRKGSLNKCE